MKRHLLYLLLTLIFTVQLYSNSFITQTPSPAKFPYVEMPFYVRLNDGSFYAPYKESDFIVEENGVKIAPELVKLECSKYQAPVQILLVVDISQSMSEKVAGKSKIEWLKISLIEFINTIDLSPFSAVGITTFGTSATNICDFTNDKTSLLNAVKKIRSVESSTDFNVALLDDSWSAYPRLSKQPDFNRTVIFLSDGKHSSNSIAFKQEAVRNALISANIKLTAIIISEEYDQSISYIKYIATETKGSCKSGQSASTLPELYRELAKAMTEAYNCQLRWLSDLYCDKDPRVTNVKITFLPLNLVAKHTYTAPAWSVFSVLQDQSNYVFGNPPPDQPVEMDIKISPKPYDMTIHKIFLTDKTYFNIIDWGDGSGLERTQIFLPAGQWLTIKVRFTQKDAYLPRKSNLNVVAYPCNASIPIYGGDIKIILQKPVATDIFTTCDSIDIEWTGTTDAATKELYYRYNYDAWTLIAKELTGFKYKWSSPQRDGKCQIKVIAYPFPSSDETVSDVSEYFTIIKPEIKPLYSPMRHDTLLIGLESKKTFSEVISNVKAEPVTIASWHFIGSAASEFTVVSIEKMTMAQDEKSGIEIAFTPTLDGQRSAKLVLIPVCGDSVSIDIMGWGICNTESLDSINFGSVIIDGFRDSTITQIFHNPMNKTVIITPYLSGVNRNQFEMVGLTGTEKIPIDPFGFYDIVIKFKPTSYGLKAAILNIGVVGCASKTTVLSGFGEYKGISINKLDFGRKRYKSKFDTLDLIISNKDKFAKTIKEVNIIKDNGDFKILNLNLPLNIKAFEDKALKVIFEPTSIDTFDTPVIVVTTEGDTLNSRFQGMCYLPELKMITECPSTLNVGDTGTARIWFYNYSKTEQLKIGLCTITDNPQEFKWIGGQPNGLNIPMMDSIFIELEYRPQAGGKHKCIIQVLADNYDGTYQKTWLSNDVDIICDAMTINYTQPIFGKLMLCDNQQSEFSISNLSYALDLDFYLDEAQIKGTDSDAFKLINTDTLTLAGGETKKLTVQFDAKHIGLHTAKLSIPNSANLPLILDLQAEGKMMVQSATPNQKTFIPGDWSNVIFAVSLPDIDKGFIDSLRLSIAWDSDVLHINALTYAQLINSDKTQPEYLILDSIAYNDGLVDYWYSCHLSTNKKYELFSYNFLSLLGNSDTTSITMNVDYHCLNDQKIVSFFEKGDYCFEPARGILIRALANYMNGPFPNPAKDQMRIDFGIEQASVILLTIYNIEGKLVKTLINESFIAGNYSKIFSLKGISPGNYFIKYSAGTYEFSKRFIVEP